MDRQTLVGPAAPPREPESLTKLEPRRVLANVVVCAGKGNEKGREVGGGGGEGEGGLG